ncbi:MAG: PPOX class F420-dependent oxidoreductase [Actinomycetota bacterium]|nr:PPOX class F420-dependent oxidoreductase [Actinomycetota bacterium]
MTELDPEVRALLEAPNFAHVATLLPDGSPASVAVWAGVHDGRPYFFTQPQSQKARNLARDGRIALSVVDRDNPYRTGRLRGQVTETIEGDAALELIDRLALTYTGQPFPRRSGVVYHIDVTRSTFFQLPFSDTPAV